MRFVRAIAPPASSLLPKKTGLPRRGVCRPGLVAEPLSTRIETRPSRGRARPAPTLYAARQEPGTPCTAREMPLFAAEQAARGVRFPIQPATWEKDLGPGRGCRITDGRRVPKTPLGAAGIIPSIDELESRLARWQRLGPARPAVSAGSAELT